MKSKLDIQPLHKTLNRYLHLYNDYKREQLKKWGSL
jgi:hypothetical protein